LFLFCVVTFAFTAQRYRIRRSRHRSSHHRFLLSFLLFGFDLPGGEHSAAAEMGLGLIQCATTLRWFEMLFCGRRGGERSGPPFRDRHDRLCLSSCPAPHAKDAGEHEVSSTTGLVALCKELHRSAGSKADDLLIPPNPQTANSLFALNFDGVASGDWESSMKAVRGKPASWWTRSRRTRRSS